MNPSQSRHTPEPPRELRERFHAGDAAAMDALAVLFFEDVLRFAMSMTGGDAELAGDAVQETFLRVLERHRLYRPSETFRPWLFAVCRNACLSLLRDRSGRAARVIGLDESENIVAHLAAQTSEAEEMAVRDALEAEAVRLLREVAEPARSIIMLHLFEGLTFREISEIIGRPQGTVGTTYYRALAALRRQLAGGDAERTAGNG